MEKSQTDAEGVKLREFGFQQGITVIGDASREIADHAVAELQRKYGISAAVAAEERGFTVELPEQSQSRDGMGKLRKEIVRVAEGLPRAEVLSGTRENRVNVAPPIGHGITTVTTDSADVNGVEHYVRITGPDAKAVTERILQAYKARVEEVLSTVRNADDHPLGKIVPQVREIEEGMEVAVMRPDKSIAGRTVVETASSILNGVAINIIDGVPGRRGR